MERCVILPVTSDTMVAPRRRPPVLTLLLDNYDSYTYNLYQMLAQVNGLAPVVLRNDAFNGVWSDAWAFFLTQVPPHAAINIVLSPGPGHPAKVGDFGLCHAAIVEAPADVPLLGVCLGHQGLAHAYGGDVRHAPKVMHGITSSINVTPLGRDGLFFGTAPTFDVVRYHSLLVASLPDCLVVTASTAEDGLIMALQHKERPQYGVQFHPESVCSEFGYQLLQNFADLSSQTPLSMCTLAHAATAPAMLAATPVAKPAAAYHLHTTGLGQLHLDGDAIFDAIYASATHAFWLDSSNGARYSYMGDAAGPLSQLITYNVVTDATHVNGAAIETPLFPYLQSQLDRYRVTSVSSPFDFRGGFVGFFGYEVLHCRHEKKSAHVLAHRDAEGSTVPDAAFLFADRFLVLDHVTGHVYVAALDDDVSSTPATTAWVQSIADRVRDMASTPTLSPPSPPLVSDPITMRPSRCRRQYEQDIADVLDAIHDGETYEVCLTNQLIAELEVPDTLAFYKTLRTLNPAPFAAYLKHPDFAICSSSPERFLHVSCDGRMESKPIKGTRKRDHIDAAVDAAIASELGSCVKDRAENMMITDLVRNDFGVVAAIGSVHVPTLMHVESYATVHQLVTTVRGALADGKSALDAVHATFPGGSMTGAPKQRTMELIRDLEVYPRGVYSGALGYLSLDGAADLNIIIRTAVVTKDRVSIGAGGAIVAMSDADDEYDEMLLKTQALRHALATHTGRAVQVDVDHGFYDK
ncbi:hypothetical protein SPRG_12737 [Saprolegnia parasitica CBS 223.65]|uniref:aminodeoxychorismate synthase n=1 Tax=Saprolegnia parasitica (strain CBS 223.65) TaxID=695850 RepID=A0A067C7C3_SAPPC|nr:hypothetical protein SPRG_12737 [Saprolegnia parasitica CBS 223.65]KDO22456.1 hypothetical protein SPRG_12737 [Saprolegnia parasitica CBS 223.65]|eukprot:XP_012206844.1 hypothetical protein SPRG_12737 [Saprolegnia parasitica CBS 223.65]